MILRVQGGGVDENICMSLAREAMVQTKPQYWQLKMYGICQYDIIFVLQYSVVLTVRDL